MTDNLPSTKHHENFHILLWLFKDLCWCADFKLAGTIMIVPTVFAAFYITFLSRKQPHDFLPNIAVCCWILANSIWMIGEFFMADSTRPFAITFFIVGLLIIFFYFLFILPKIKQLK